MLAIAKPQRVTIEGVNTIDSSEDQSQTLCKVQVKLMFPLDEKQLEALPIDHEAVALLLDESKAITEGKNDLKISFKRDLGLSTYTILQPPASKKKAQPVVGFVGEVKGTPFVKIVMGKAFACGRIETQLPFEDEGRLSSLVNRDDIRITVKRHQGELQLVKGEAA